MDQLGLTIRRRAAELGLTQTQLADLVGVHVRQIRRYERGEQQPVLSVAKRLADALQVSLDDLAGGSADPLDGAWWIARTVEVDGRELTATVEARLTTTRGVTVVEGRGWRGELRRADGSLAGWYADEQGRQGTLLFVVADDVARGRWVSTSADGGIVTGHAALARERATAQRLIAEPAR